MSDLSKKKCVPCEGNVPPLRRDEIMKLLKEIPKWELSEDMKSISREFTFEDFRWAISFVNEVADLADFEGHHPDIHIWYNKVVLELSTHAIDGLSENDFILAAKINNIDQA